MKTKQTGKPILDALLNASESLDNKTPESDNQRNETRAAQRQPKVIIHKHKTFHEKMNQYKAEKRAVSGTQVIGVDYGYGDSKSVTDYQKQLADAEYYGESGGSKMKKITAPAQAQHSPYALQAVMNQLMRWKNEGNDSIYFGALSDHPETDEETTFGDLVEHAFNQYETLEAHAQRLADALDSLLSLGSSEQFGQWEAWEEVRTAREALAECSKQK